MLRATLKIALASLLARWRSAALRRARARRCGGSRSSRATTTAAATRAPLLYAGADARKVHDILTRLGGVRPEDAQLLLDASARSCSPPWPASRARAAEAARRGERTALFFYYSGHAKDGALRLGRRASRSTAQGALAASPVDVRIAILDSCRSGALTRTKGARARPRSRSSPTAARDAKGLVILTSSTSDEDSQESDPWAAATSRTTWPAGCWAAPTARATDA